MRKFAVAVCLACSLAFLFQGARAQSDAIALSVEGHGFSVSTLHGGGRAFANRSYVWDQVPPQFDGWNFTKTKGGERAEIAVNGASDGYVYIAIDTASRAPGEGLPGWEPCQNLFLQLTNKQRTLYAVYRAHHVAGAALTIPQVGWGGSLVLSPKLTRSGEAAESVIPAAIVVGAPVIHSRVVVGEERHVVVHPSHIHVVEHHVVHHVERRTVVAHRTTAGHPAHAARVPITAGGRL